MADDAATATTRRWRKSTLSGNSGCVEVSPATGGIAIRDSKHPGGPELRYTPVEWAAFLGGAKSGEFDDLIPAQGDPRK